MGKRDSMLMKIDSALCCLNNMSVDIVDFIQHSIDSNILKNRNLVKSRETPCFIIGNGPSLNKVDLSIINEFTTITVNGFYLKDCGLKSTYHVFVDPIYKEDKFWPQIVKSKELSPSVVYITTKQLGDTIQSIVHNENEVIRILANHCQVGTDIEIDMCREMTGSLNVIPVAIECAMYMGFKKICLLGCDFSMYTRAKGMHFYDNENQYEMPNKFDFSKNEVGNLLRCALVHKQYYCIEMKARKMGIEIVNATEDSMIDAFESVNLLDYFSNKINDNKK